MVIVIDNEYEKEIIKNKLSDEEFNQIERLFELMRDNKLFLLSSFQFYNFFLKYYGSNVSSRTRKLIERLINDGSTIISEARKITPLIKIHDNNFASKLIDGVFNIKISELPDDLTPYICSENPDDAKFYLFVYKNITQYSQMTYIIPEGCGGGDVGSYLTNWIANNRVFFLIADSDIKFNGCDEGGTAKKIRTFFPSNNHPFFADYHILTVHEKENMFPFELYKPKQKIKSLIKYIVGLSNNDEYRDYYDIKDGISKNDDACAAQMKIEWQNLYVPIINYVKSNGLVEIDPNSKKIISGVGHDEVSNRMKEGINFTHFKSLLTKNQKNNYKIINDLILKFGFSYYLKTS